MPEDTTQQPIHTSTASHTIREMAGAAMVEILGSVILQKMGEHPKFGAGLLMAGGATITSIGTIWYYNLTKK